MSLSTHTTATVMAAAGNGGDLFDWARALFSDFDSTVRLGIYVAAAVIFLLAVIKTRGSMAGIVVGLISGLLVIVAAGWLVPDSKPIGRIDETFGAPAWGPAPVGHDESTFGSPSPAAVAQIR